LPAKEKVNILLVDDQPIAEFRPERIGVGISGMRQPINEFGGQFRLSGTNPGRLVEAVIPLPEESIREKLEPSAA